MSEEHAVISDVGASAASTGADTPTTPSRPGWRRDTVLFMAGQFASMFGSSVVAYAIIWHITLKTGSGAQYAWLLIAAQLPMALTTIPGGVWADRYWRKALMIGADTAVAVITVLLALIMLAGHEELWLIAVALMLRGLFGGIQQPAAGAALPQIVPTEHLLRVNSLNQSLMAVIFIAAPALSAVLLQYVPLGMILFVDVTTAVIGIGLTLLVAIPRLSAESIVVPQGVTGYFRHVGEAARTLFSHPGLRRLTILFAFIIVIVIPFAQMTPVFVVRLFGRESWKLAGVEILWSVGMIVGGLALAAWGGFKNRMSMMLLACGVISVMTMVMGFTPNIWCFFVVMFICGFALTMMNTPATTAIQEIIPEAMMGRVMSLITLMNTLGGPIGMAIVGPLSDRLNIAWMALVGGGAGLLFTLFWLLRGGPGAKLVALDK